MLRQLLTLPLAVAICASAHAATTKPNNPYGMMLMADGSATTSGQLHHMKLARDFCGEWGYVRTGGRMTDEAIEGAVRTLVACRAMHLIPVFGSFEIPEEYYDPEIKARPMYDPDGSLTTFGKYYEDWLRKLYDRGVTMPYFEYGNEVNGGYYGEHPEVYAQMCIAVSKAFKRVDPDLCFGTAGMAGCAHGFYDEMLTKVPELKDHVGYWGLHPYAANHPPGYCLELGDYGVASHQWTARALAKHGIENPVFLMTETGFELGNEKDARFPKITEELRAEYLVEAFKRFWEPDPRVRGVMPFMLQDTRWSNWGGWDFIREDYTLTPMYEAVRDLPKPKGKDFLPGGPCTVKGRVTDAELGAGVGGYLVWIRRPHFAYYAAVTDEDGSYEIAGVPEGEYDVSGFCDGYTSTEVERVVLRKGKRATWDASVKCTGLVGQLDGEPGQWKIAPGWTASADEAAYALDGTVKRNGTASQRIEAGEGGRGIFMYSGYESCLPDRVYTAEVWVKTKGLVRGDREGVTLSLDVTNSYARFLSGAKVRLSVEGDSDWRPLTIALRSVPKGRRFKVSLDVDAEAGTVWFDDVILHEANRPLPSAYGLASAEAAHISGAVFAPGGKRRLGKATVCTVPFGRWAVTDYMGHFRIDGLPPGKYDVWAFHPEFNSACIERLEVGGEGASGVEIALCEILVPGELLDPGFEDIPEILTWFSNWSRFGTSEGIVRAGWHKNLRIDGFTEGFQPHSGEGFYGAVSGSNIKDGGIYQTIAVEPDALYEVSVWSMTYQTSDGVRGDVANRLGADPMGGKDTDSPYVVWTPFRPSHKKWTRLSLRVRPVKPKMTVFLHHLQVHGIKFNCNLFDDVEVKKIGPPETGPEAGY